MNFHIDLNVIILILPVYIYLFISLTKKEKKNELTEELVKLLIEKHTTEAQKPIEKNVKEVEENVKVLDKKIDTVESNLKIDISKLDLTIGAKIEQSIAESIQLRSYLTQEEKAHLDMKLLEENRRINIDNGHIDLQMKRIVNDVIDIYFKNNYLARREAYDISTGMFNLPMITDQTKADDIKEIYEQVMILLDAEYVKANFDAVYDLSRPETKLFLIEKYIVPPYADKLEQMISDWQSIQRAMEEDGMEKEKELQEYFLIWIHQIKTPITAGKLICDGDIENENVKNIKKELIYI